jgi:hypothetical protein
MVIHYPPARLRQNSDRPTAITNVLVATSGSSSRTGDVALGTPTCSARTRHGRWALYPNGDQVVVVWPGGRWPDHRSRSPASSTAWAVITTTVSAMRPPRRSGSS